MLDLMIYKHMVSVRIDGALQYACCKPIILQSIKHIHKKMIFIYMFFFGVAQLNEDSNDTRFSCLSQLNFSHPNFYYWFLICSQCIYKQSHSTSCQSLSRCAGRHCLSANKPFATNQSWFSAIPRNKMIMLIEMAQSSYHAMLDRVARPSSPRSDVHHWSFF